MSKCNRVLPISWSIGIKLVIKSIPSPEGTNAVRIMTIHKSKGLEFPVVIFPFAEENFSSKPKDKLWIPLEDANVNFPKALINNKKKWKHTEVKQKQFSKPKIKKKF